MHPLRGATAATRFVNDRGPRYAVVGSVRKGEYVGYYSDTATGADIFEENLRANGGYYQIKVTPPNGSIDLAELGRDRQAAKRAYDEATAVLRAGVLRALEAGRSEREIAQQAVVSRDTIRDWQGK